MANNKFYTFGESSTNILSDAGYLADTQRTSGVSGVARAILHNKLFKQVSMMVSAIGEAIKDEGNEANDSSFSGLVTALKKSFVRFSDIRGTGTESFKTNTSCIANNYRSCAEGDGTFAMGRAGHAEGSYTSANGNCSHAENVYSIADGIGSHAEGFMTNSHGNYSHSSGCVTFADHEGATICGKYGSTTEAYGWFLANGIDGESNEGLAAKILSSGNAFCDGSWSGNGADYAEFFEWEDGNPLNEDRVGLFVSLNGDKLVLAGEYSDYILGILSATPSIIGNSGEMRWSKKYVTDEWGRVQYHTVTVPEVKIGDEVILPARSEVQPILNLGWDNSLEYQPRRDRVEWDAIGMLGKIRVRDDGSCVVNGYCKPTTGGIATASDKGYRVIKRYTDNIIEVIFR